jgi:hypothetical protein
MRVALLLFLFVSVVCTGSDTPPTYDVTGKIIIGAQYSELGLLNEEDRPGTRQYDFGLELSKLIMTKTYSLFYVKGIAKTEFIKEEDEKLQNRQILRAEGIIEF